jgi:aryl-alcohol dehydrogenase-like predicted oxidoreductase
MKYRQLGKTDLKISTIGFGTWGLGGNHDGAVGYGPTDDRESEQALRAAFENGINLFDTADLYGAGHSERLLGRTFHKIRGQVIFASKAGFLNPKGDQDFSIARIRECIDQSLRRLQTDYLDIFQLHGPDVRKELVEKSELMQLMEELRKAGKFRALGISVRSPEEGLEAIQLPGVDCIQVNFNLADQRAVENGLFESCDKSRVGVLVRTPLCFGFLTRGVTADQKFPEGDHRVRFTEQQKAAWIAIYDTLSGELENGDSTALATPAQQCLRFCLSFPGVTSTLVGMLSHREVAENSAAAGLPPIPVERLARIHSRYKEFGGKSAPL